MNRIRSAIQFLFDREAFSWSAWSAAAYFRGFIQRYVAETSPARLVRDALGQSRPKFLSLKLAYHRIAGAVRIMRGLDSITPALFALLATQHLTQYMHLIVDPSGALLGHIIEQTIAEQTIARPSAGDAMAEFDAGMLRDADPEEVNLSFLRAMRRG